MNKDFNDFADSMLYALNVAIIIAMTVFLLTHAPEVESQNRGAICTNGEIVIHVPRDAICPAGFWKELL